MGVMSSQSPLSQAEIDRLTYDTFVELGCDAAETARQLGVIRATVKGRVRRHVARLRGERV